jgi:hypothetical protein
MNERKMICFDMDGTIVDLYGVNGWLEMLKNEDTTPYISAKPIWDMEELNTVLTALQAKGWIISIVTWLAMNSTEEYKKATRKAKIEWLEENNFIYDEFHGVQYGTTKANTVRNKTDYAILIDDNRKVRNGWTLGKTVDPLAVDLVEWLRGLLV